MKVMELELMLNEHRETYVTSNGWRKADGRFKACNPDSVYALMTQAFKADRRPEEHVWLLCLDGKLALKGVFEVSKGSANASMFPARELVRDALMVDASAMIVVHNHPSGDPTPSDEDIASTRQLREAAKLVGLELSDHVIIGDGVFTSLRQQGKGGF